ncbi:MAG: hypothetical protein AAFZ65_14230, partial [Planctomycetota bacterium]
LGLGSGGHVVKNCIAWDNRLTGFSTNSAEAPCHVYNCTGMSNGEENFRFANSGSPYRHTVTNCLSLDSTVTIDPNHKGVVSLNNSWDLGYTPTAADFLSVPPAPFPLPDPRIAGGHVNPWNLNPLWNGGAVTPPLFVPNWLSTNSMVDLGYTSGPLRGQLAIGVNNNDNPLVPETEYNRYRAPDLGAKEVAPAIPSGTEIFLVQATAVVNDDLSVSPTVLVLTGPTAKRLLVGTPVTIDDLWTGGTDRLLSATDVPLLDTLAAGKCFLIDPSTLEQQSARIFLQADDGTTFSDVVPVSLNLD